MVIFHIHNNRGVHSFEKIQTITESKLNHCILVEHFFVGIKIEPIQRNLMLICSDIRF